MRLGKQGISKHATCEQRNHGCKKCREKSTVHLMRAFTWLTQPELLTLLICFACKGFAGAAATRARPSKNIGVRLLTPRYPIPLLWHQGGPTANDNARSISRKNRCTQLACLRHGKSDVGQRLPRSAATLRRFSMITISAHGDADARQRCISAGALAFFSKPLQDTELLVAIGAARKITRKPRIAPRCK